MYLFNNTPIQTRFDESDKKIASELNKITDNELLNCDLQKIADRIEQQYSIICDTEFTTEDVEPISDLMPIVLNNSPQKKVVTHRFEPTSKKVLLFIGGLALSLVLSIWGNLTQWREHQNWEEADLKYRALKMVLPSDDPNIRYIEKHFNVQRDEDIINNVRNRVTAYEDSVRYHYEMIEMAAYKDSLAKQLNKEANDIKERLKK